MSTPVCLRSVLDSDVLDTRDEKMTKGTLLQEFPYILSKFNKRFTLSLRSIILRIIVVREKIRAVYIVDLKRSVVETQFLILKA